MKLKKFMTQLLIQLTTDKIPTPHQPPRNAGRHRGYRGAGRSPASFVPVDVVFEVQPYNRFYNSRPGSVLARRAISFPAQEPVCASVSDVRARLRACPSGCHAFQYEQHPNPHTTPTITARRPHCRPVTLPHLSPPVVYPKFKLFH